METTSPVTITLGEENKEGIYSQKIVTSPKIMTDATKNSTITRALPFIPIKNATARIMIIVKLIFLSFQNKIKVFQKKHHSVTYSM